MPEPTREPSADWRGADAVFEDLLVAALERFEADGSAGIERFLAAHPAHADRLRAHLLRLHRVGLTTDADGPPAPPERLGEFRILQVLGGGAMGVVYRAVQEPLGREVALKVVRPDQLLFPGTRERFRREIELVARMQHPGIVPIHTVGQDGGVPFFAMELVRGASLAEIITHAAAMPRATRDGAAFDRAIAARLGETGPRETAALFAGTWVQAALRVVREIAEALEHAHRRGVLHRDVKPSNVMLTRDGRVLLLDFGLAGAAGGERLTRTGSTLGSLAYLPPELLGDPGAARDARSDVYSLGVTCWELLALRLPYEGSDPVRLHALANGGARPRLASIDPAIGWEVETVVATAIDPDRARRYASASAFGHDLDNLLHARPIEAREVGVWLRVRRWTQRHPARAIAAAAAFLLFCVAPSLFLWQQAVAGERIRGERDRAREAVEVLLTRVATEDLLQAPRLQRMRRDLLASARSFYDRFLRDSSGDADLLDDAAYAALQLAVLDAEIGQAADSLRSADEAVSLARELVARDEAATTRLAEALLCQGRARHSLGQSEAALAALTEARDLRAAGLARHPHDVDVATGLLAAERTRAEVLSLLGRRDAEAECYRAIAALWRGIEARAGAAGAPPAAVDHALCAAADEAEQLLLGDRPEAAREALARGRILATDLPAAAPASSRVAASRLCMTSARLCVAAQDDPAAEAEFRAAIAGVAGVLEQNPEHAGALRVEADAYNSLSILLVRTQRRAEARDALAASTERLRRMLALDPDIVANRRNLAVNLGNLGAMLQAEGRLQEALATFDEAQVHLDRAAAVEGPVPILREHSFKLTWFRGQVNGALGHVRPTLEAARAMAALKPDDARVQRIAAGLCATAAGAAAKAADAALQRDAEAAGMSLLQRAAELGCTDLEWLRSGAEFAPLRRLDGYAAILTAIEANVARKAASGDGNR